MNRSYLLLAGLFAGVLIVVLNVPTRHGTNVPSEAPPAMVAGQAGEPTQIR